MTTTASPSDGSEPDKPDKPVKPTRPKKPKKPKLSKEQELLERYAKLENFPELFLAKKPYPWVKEILTALDQPIARVAVRAGNGVGKTSELVAPAILHFLINYPGSQVVVTAGVYRQISEVLWPVLRNLVNGMGPDVAECFSITENRIKYTAPSEPGQPLHEPALCNGFSADKPESAEGWHARPPCHQLLYIIDEAKAVPDGIFDAMERCQPTRVLEVSSPGARAGRFFERFNKADGRYKLFQVTAHDCPHIKKEWIDQQVAAYGLGSQVVQSMVFAEFGDEDGASLVLTPGVLQRCISSPPAPQGQMLRAGCDFAAGGDENVIQILEGNRVKATITWREKDTMAAVGRFITEFKRHGLEPSHIWADNGGIGIPMCDALHEAGWTINRVNNGEAAYDSNKFANRGTEMWVQFARQVELGKVILPKDDILHRQLTTRRLEHNSKGKLMVEPKPKMKDRGLDSPDRADALILAMCGGGMSMEEYMVKAGKRVSFGDIEVDDMEGIAGAYAG